MKSIWKFVAFILGGIIIGIVGADKLQLGVKTVFKGKVNIKQKGRGNVQDTDIKPEIATESRRAGRIVNKLEKQKAKAQKKLEKADGK
jgi:hypothetical protein